jgi:hypothetical protein
MATLERPLKEGSVRTYQAKVGLGFLDILAAEVDADLDTIYAAWNGGLADGSVTGAKLATGAVGTRELSDLGVTNPKLAVGAAVHTVAEHVITGPLQLTGTLTPLLACNNLSLRGGPILLSATMHLRWDVLAAGSASPRVYLRQDGAVLQQWIADITATSAMVGGLLPLTMTFSRVLQGVAGTHSFDVAGSNGNLTSANFWITAFAWMTVYEFA